jgi:hypothetical protein
MPAVPGLLASRLFERPGEQILILYTVWNGIIYDAVFFFTFFSLHQFARLD